MTNLIHDAQARYRARQALKVTYFDFLDRERVDRLRASLPPLDATPEQQAVRRALLANPRCVAGVLDVAVTTKAFHTPTPIPPTLIVQFAPGDPNTRLCAAVALAALGMVTSTPAFATDGVEIFGAEDDDVSVARSEIEDLQRLGLWERNE